MEGAGSAGRERDGSAEPEPGEQPASRGTGKDAKENRKETSSSSYEGRSSSSEDRSSSEVESESSLQDGVTEQPAPGPGSKVLGGIRREISTSLDTLSRSPQDKSSAGKSDGTTEPRTETSLQKSTTKQPAPNTGTKGLPTILGGIRRETCSPSLHKLSRERKTSYNVDYSTQEKPLGISVSMQTETSWIYEHMYRKTIQRKTEELKKDSIHVATAAGNDIHAVLSQDLSSLGILCDMEFNEDFIRLFEESLRTLSHIGPPTILAYRPESSREGLEIQIEEESTATCEYCGSLLKLFPSYEDLDPTSEDYESFFCCEQNQDLYEYITTEKKNYENARNKSISVDPHAAHGSEVDRQQAREKEYQRQQERQIAKQFAFMAAEQASFVEYSKQLKTISYQLSREPPSPGGWTLMPYETVERLEKEEINYSITCCDFTIAGGKLVKRQFLEKYYKHGGKFLTIFPDGTAQLFYPSGNLAVIIVQKRRGYICIVQEDKPNNATIQAVFESSGKGTCYHPNGIVWININIQGGHYSDQAGNRVRMWTWPSNLMDSGPRISFKPIFISLNQYVGVRIVGQDKIAVSFLAMGQQAKFNVGTKVQVRQPGKLPPPKHVCEEDLLLFACKIKIQRLFDRLHGCLSFPSTEQWDKIKPPSYLATQALKLMYLCKNSDISDDVDCSIRAIINAPV
ncbi:glutamate-rich protein 6 [Malaclemys terrapin pileata]|uniref:glutamate-rich protein 6 n=1 Tax=Malaclemys terrapin pileata TaxID=2991368 RepID=UPI0023A8CACE|nr:glutamate-rich protein 6 [Malaclemys terrapin pileata]